MFLRKATPVLCRCSQDTAPSTSGVRSSRFWLAGVRRHPYRRRCVLGGTGSTHESGRRPPELENGGSMTLEPTEAKATAASAFDPVAPLITNDVGMGADHRAGTPRCRRHQDDHRWPGLPERRRARHSRRRPYRPRLPARHRGRRHGALATGRPGDPPGQGGPRRRGPSR